MVVLSNLPYKKEVIENCPNLKMTYVAFSGGDHVALDFCKEKDIDFNNIEKWLKGTPQNVM